VSDSLAHESESEDAENRLPSSQNDFSRVDVLDDKARRQVAARLLEIEKDLAYKGEIQDIQGESMHCRKSIPFSSLTSGVL
jgi:hypothetical protein